MSSHEEFSEYLRGEWLVARGSAIYDEMWETFSKLAAKRTGPRHRELMEKSRETMPMPGIARDTAEVARSMVAHTQAMAENVLLAVSIYLAGHETPPAAE